MKRYIAAAAVAAAGLAGAAALAVGAYLSVAEPVRFVAPGAGSIDVAAPGRYIIWHEYRSNFENRVYRSAPGLPAGARFTVRGPEGPPLPVGPASSMSWSSGDDARQAVGSFEAPVSGRYTVVLDGDFPAQVISVQPDFLLRLMLLAGGAVLVALLGVGTGIGMLVWALAAGEAVVIKSGMEARPEAAPVDAHKELRDMANLVYALYAASIVVGITLLGGLVVAYLKRDDAAGTWLESHYRWQIRSFWWLLVWGAIGAVTAALLVGFAVWFIAAVWFIYRIAKGWLALREGKPVGAPS